MVRTVRRGKSGLHRVGWRLITARREARNRATETSPVQSGAQDEDGGETRQPPPGATPNRQALTRPAELAGRWLEPCSNVRPRGMVAHDRTRLNGQLHFSYAGHSLARQPPAFLEQFPLRGDFGALSPGGDAPIRCNCLIFKHNYLMRYIQYAQYPIVFIDVLLQEKTVKIEVNKLL